MPSLFLLASLALTGNPITLEEAIGKIPEQELPEFWIGEITGLAARWDTLTKGEVRTIAISPAGHPIHLITYGEKEEMPRHANFNSAIGARAPERYIDKGSRKRPVVMIVGPVHGQEVEGLTGVVNLIHVMETGRDLRGRDQTELQALGQQCRLVIIPAGNPDAITRFIPKTGRGMSLSEFAWWGMGTWKDGTIAEWPTSKGQHPFKGPEIGHIGCYFNDDGINPMHDEFFDPMGPEAPAILKVAMEEGPDLAVSLHTWGQPPAFLRPAYVPREVQKEVQALARRYKQMLADRDIPNGGIFDVREESGEFPAPFNLTSALYHVSGAASFTHETPAGLVSDDPKIIMVSFEEILDMQLVLYKAMFRHAIER